MLCSLAVGLSLGDLACQEFGCLRVTTGAFVITNAILSVTYYKYSIPQNPLLIIKASIFGGS